MAGLDEEALALGMGRQHRPVSGKRQAEASVRHSSNSP